MNHLRITLVLALCFIAVVALGQKPPTPSADAKLQTATPSDTPAFTENNPFAKASTLPYQAPPFDKIKDGDFQPAIEEGMRQELAEVEAIANASTAPTFDNTIVPMEKSGELLRRVGRVFFGIAQSNTNPNIQKVQTVLAPEMAAHRDAINLNAKLFARIKAVYDQRDTLKLNPEQKRLVETYYKDFVRSGALLSEDDKSKLRELNKEQSKLTNEFRQKVLAATNAGALVIDDKALLEGLSDADIATAAAKAKARGLAGKYVITLQNTTHQPALTSLRDRALRERLLAVSSARGTEGEYDTRPIVARLAQLRAERAKLLGFSSHAAYELDDRMAKTPENAIKLLTDIAPAATNKARAEAARMQQLIDAQKGDFKLAPQDWDFYAEEVRKADFDLDEAAVRPYFELSRVVNDGVFYAANRLYGITFKPRKDIPVYDPDVKVWEVFDKDGKPLALFYGDYFSRPGKAGGAWSSGFVGQSKLLGTKPIVTNNLNITRPADGQPALLTFDEVGTLFHEFGHALNSLFSNVTYPSQNGGLSRDFVEVPSQFNEHWALEPSVFANYAKHYETGKPMPKELVERIKSVKTFNQGFATTEYLEAALLDMAWHSLPADAPQQDPVKFERDALAKYKVDLAEVPPRYHTTYFSHIWAGGYSAGYYAYLWSEVIDQDAYYWFKEHGGMTRENGQRFRDMILSKGSTMDAAEMYRAFRGRDAVVEPLLIERGLKEVPEVKG
ncbi:MAG: M3 family metallopeptidase, partial [Thermoanaerobaculia bacterium]